MSSSNSKNENETITVSPDNNNLETNSNYNPLSELVTPIVSPTSAAAALDNGANATSDDPNNAANNKEDSEPEADLDTVQFEQGKSVQLSKQRNEMREKMTLLLEQLDEEQLKRYETYRRSGFPKATMKKIIQNLLGQTSASINPNLIIVMCGVAKVYVGQVVEEALRVKEDWNAGSNIISSANVSNEDDPILPSHLREAARRLKKRGVLGSTNLVNYVSKSLF